MREEAQEGTKGWEMGGKGKRNDPKPARESTRTETRAHRASSPPFSPFTYTLAAGNGIANPTTLHASWQLVISRPVLRQHTPRYPLHLPFISLSLSLSLPPFHQNCFARRDILVLSPAQITRTRINYFGVNVTR